MGFLDSLFKGLQDFAESDAGQRLRERAEQLQAEEIAKTSGKNGLRCTLNNLTKQCGGTLFSCEGTVKNIGRSTYRSIEIMVTFKDENNSVVDKQMVTVYAGSLEPGESKPFRVDSIARNIQSASAAIEDFREIS